MHHYHEAKGEGAGLGVWAWMGVGISRAAEPPLLTVCTAKKEFYGTDNMN